MKVECPRCHKIVEWEKTPTRPFCSERCRLIDLGQWAEEKYVVPENHDNQDDNSPDLNQVDESGD